MTLLELTLDTALEFSMACWSAAVSLIAEKLTVEALKATCSWLNIVIRALGVIGPIVWGRVGQAACLLVLVCVE